MQGFEVVLVILASTLYIGVAVDQLYCLCKTTVAFGCAGLGFAADALPTRRVRAWTMNPIWSRLMLPCDETAEI